MHTRLTLRPGQKGTQRLCQKYGERLLAVRYRYDETRRRRLKTVELVEEQLPWLPPWPADLDPEKIVAVRISYDETRLREQARESGGRWHPGRKRWLMKQATAYELGLERRIDAKERESDGQKGI